MVKIMFNHEKRICLILTKNYTIIIWIN